MREKMIEDRLRLAVKKLGGKAYKFTSPGNAGVPDRLVVLPGGRVCFVELKAPGKTPTPLQAKKMQELRALGCGVRLIDSIEGVDAFIEECWGIMTGRKDEAR